VVKHPEHACGDAVVALIVIEAECGVGVKRVEAVVLRLICPQRDQAGGLPEPDRE
jgi:hypothetical protein